MNNFPAPKTLLDKSSQENMSVSGNIRVLVMSAERGVEIVGVGYIFRYYVERANPTG